MATSDWSFSSRVPSFQRLESTSFSTQVNALDHRCSDHLSSCQLCWCHPCPFEDHECGRHQDVEDHWEEEDKVGGSRSSAKCWAQFVLSHAKYPCSEGLSWSFKRLLSLFGMSVTPTSCRDCLCISTNAVFASWCPSLADKGGACPSSSTLRRQSRLWYLLLCSCAALWEISFYAMWSKYLTQASDQILGKLRLPVGLIILPSIPDRRKFSSALFFGTRSASFALW